MRKTNLRIAGVVILTILATTLMQPLTLFEALAQHGEPCQTFPETGKTVCGAFLRYWQEHGGLPIFGYPISQPFEEQSPLDGKSYTVQYFERAVFEAHPENAPPYNVLLSQLGALRFHSQYPQGDPSEPYTDDLPRYPGAEGLQVANYEDGVNPNVVMTYIAPAPADEVAAFYKEVMRKRGWETPEPQRDPNIYYFEYPPKSMPAPIYGISVLLTSKGKSRTGVEVDYTIPGCCW